MHHLENAARRVADAHLHVPKTPGAHCFAVAATLDSFIRTHSRLSFTPSVMQVRFLTLPLDIIILSNARMEQ